MNSYFLYKQDELGRVHSYLWQGEVHKYVVKVIEPFHSGMNSTRSIYCDYLDEAITALHEAVEEDIERYGAKVREKTENYIQKALEKLKCQ